MNRRTFVKASGGIVGGLPLSGCLSDLMKTQPSGVPPVVENRPNAVYYPTHVEGMKTAGTARKGDYTFGLMWSYPHRFWNVNGSEVSKTAIQSDDSLHLTATVWDPETRTVLPDTGLSVEIAKEGSLVSQEVIYPMLSQPMGFHYGANFALEGDGTYAAKLSVGAMRTRRTGAFAERFTDPTTVELQFDYSEKAKKEITFRRLPEKAGKKGAVDLMEMQMPNSLAPKKEKLPGHVLGEGASGDGVFVATVLNTPPKAIDGEGAYLALSPRTPYNRIILPAMALSATLERGGETVYDGPLKRTLDPELNYHYGAVVKEVRSGDTLTVSVDTPPQTARHEGYETAFVEMADVKLSL